MQNLQDFEEFMIEEELALNTRNTYLYALKDFFSRYHELNKRNILEWKAVLQSKFKPQTVNLRLAAMEKYCKFQGITIPVKRIKIHRTGSVENVITPEQYEKLVKGLESDGLTRWLVIVKIMAKTGARVFEALKFTKKDIQAGYVDLPAKGKIRRIYFPKSLTEELNSYLINLKDNDVLCTNHYGAPITSRGISSQLKIFAVKYGIPKENAHPHAFRHFFAIEFLKRNSNISLLADLLGHSGVNTTMIYLRMSQAQQKEAVDHAVNW